MDGLPITLGFMPTENVKAYLRRIGAKGGRKSAKHPARKRLNQHAANERWRRKHPKPKEII